MKKTTIRKKKLKKGNFYEVNKTMFPRNQKVFAKILHRQKDLNQEKLDNLLKRYLQRGTKKFIKPILAIYLTTDMQRQINHTGSKFLKSLTESVHGRYYVICLPAFDAEKVRTELWFKGNKLSKAEKKIYENNIWAFMSFTSAREPAFDLSSVPGIIV